MAPFDECSVLLPSATLEDFPIGGSDSDARSLLAGWTVLWHPLLLAQTEQLPTWYRADVPPTPDGPRVVVVPEPSIGQVTSDFQRRCTANPSCLWVTGADRQTMLTALGLAPDDPAAAPLEFSGRRLEVADFYAAGYLSLQIQIMTRRLRYTSNLDELHLQNRITAAAKAFRDRDAAAAAEGLHDVFDCLSEERDHYFSSDPHLIDLTLLTPSVLDKSINAGWIDRIRHSAGADDEGNGVLGTPRNVLIDGEVAAMLSNAKDDPARDKNYQPLRDLLSDDSIGWAGGGSHDHDHQPACLDAMTIASAKHAFESGTQLAQHALGETPTVYARLSGMTPADLVPALAGLGYKGVIPIDFSAGTGFGDESKVIVSGGGSELEALTAKPIDAASDAAFLSLGAHLGESIDSGEIATALLVHWPDRVCDSFLDLCRAATWSVALGRFWTLQNYFTDGERPYHHGSLNAISNVSAAVVAERLINPEYGETLESMSQAFAELVRQETRRMSSGIAKLANPGLADTPDLGGPDDVAAEKSNDSASAICKAIGVTPKPGFDQQPASAANTNQPHKDVVCFNPHGVAIRQQTVLQGGAPADEKYIYAASDAGAGGCDVTFDVPAMGFTRLFAQNRIKKTGLLKRLTGRQKGIADGTILRNEFMAVTLDEASGGVSGVFSASRGNRLSLRLVAAEGISGGKEGGQMICRRVERLQSDLSAGIIRASGQLNDSDGKAVADFELNYRLDRGSRLLQINGTLTPKSNHNIASDGELWKNYFAVRTAVAGEASIIRVLVRDKVHSCNAKRIVSPLGVLIDEAEKQTMVTGHGLPLYRKVGDRFLDTLVGLPKQQSSSGQAPDPADKFTFQVSIAFDSPGPIAVARACLAPPEVIAIEASGGSDTPHAGKTDQAWLVHSSAGEVLITEMSTQRRRDGKLAARMQLVQTRPKSSRVKLQFCVFAHAAFKADDSGINRALEELPENVSCEDGVVSLTVGSHEMIDLVVVFDV